MERYTEEKLNKMSVHTLRVILRSEFNGVPGVCNKSELISQILDIQGGASAPLRSTKGRKPLGEFITPIGEDITFADVTEDESNVKKGVFELNAEGYGFVRVNKNTEFVDFFVPKTLVKKYSLRTGDEIECFVYYASELGSLNVKSINSVNGRMPEGREESSNSTSLKAKYPDEKINFKKGKSKIVDVIDVFCPLGKGQRCLVEDAEGRHGTKFVNTLLENLSDDNLTVISLFAGVKPEELVDVEQAKKRQHIALPIDLGAEEILRIVNLTVERAKTLCQMGENVLLVLDSFSYVANVYGDYSECGKQSGYVKTGLNKNKYATEIFCAGGNFGENRSLTVIVTVDANRDEKLVAELLSVATSVIRLENSNILSRRGYVVDLVSSYTDKDDILLDAEQIAYADEERDKLAQNADCLAKIYGK